MTALHSQTARDARDGVVLSLGLGIPYPLRDLPLDFVTEVPHGLPTDIRIRGAQGGVLYLLCDEEGSALLSWTFTKDSFADLTSLAQKLKNPQRPVDTWLAGKLSTATQAALAAFPGADPAALIAALSQDLNLIISDTSIYDTQRFSGVTLRPETQQLQSQVAQGSAIVQLNRMLLEDAYPAELSRTHPEITAELSAHQGLEAVILDSSSLLTTGDLQDQDAFLQALAPAATGVAGLLWNALTEPTQTLLTNPGDTPASAVADATTIDLSKLLSGPLIYDPVVFSDVCLSPWTRDLLLPTPPTVTDDVRRLNRFLLEDAFPLLIWRTLALPTTPVLGDITFTILASRPDASGVAPAETYLTGSVAIRAGITKSLPVAFWPDGGQKIVVPYGGAVTVTVDASQEGVSYQLVLNDPANDPLSPAVVGNRRTISLSTNVPLREDSTLRVKAFRTSAPDTSKLLDAVLTVTVMPNQAVTIQVNPQIANYDGTPTLTLAAAQTTAVYTLYQRRIATGEYVSPGTAGAWQITGDQNQVISVCVLDFGDGTKVPASFTSVGPFAPANNALQITLGAIQEDTFFIVQAVKQITNESLLLSQRQAILVRPNPQPAVTSAQPSVLTGTRGLVIVTGTQQGVRYQLELASNAAPVGNPGYHVTDRGIGTMRVETDFVIDGQGDPRVLLPTDPMAAKTEFQVVATKNLTGLTAPLSNTTTIDVTAATPTPAPSPPPPAGGGH